MDNWEERGGKMGEERRKVSKYKNTTDMYYVQKSSTGRHAPYHA